MGLQMLMRSQNELACVYASLLLIDDDTAVTSEKLQTVLKAANIDVEPYWPGLSAKSLESINPKDLITSIAASTAAAPLAESPKAVEKKKVEVEEESDDNMGFGLFD